MPGLSGLIQPPQGLTAGITPHPVGADLWDQTGTVIHQKTLTDPVVIGGTAAVSTQIFRVVGGARFEGNADEKQVLIKANGTQTATLLEIQNSIGTVTHFVVDASGKVAIGAASPGTEELLVQDNVNAGTFVAVKNTVSNTAARRGLILQSGVAGEEAELFVTSPGWTPVTNRIADALHLEAAAGLGGGMQIMVRASAPMSFWTADTKRMTLNGATDTLLIGTDTALAGANDAIQTDKTLNGTYNGVRCRNLSAGTVALAEFIAHNDDDKRAQIGITSSGYTGSPNAASQTFISSTGAGGMMFRNTVSSSWTWLINLTTRMELTGAGSLLVGGSTLFGAALIQARKDQNTETTMGAVNLTDGTASRAIVGARSTSTGLGLYAWSPSFTASFGQEGGANGVLSSGNLILLTQATGQVIKFKTGAYVLAGTITGDQAWILGSPSAVLVAGDLVNMRKDQVGATLVRTANNTGGATAQTLNVVQQESGASRVQGAIICYSPTSTFGGERKPGEAHLSFEGSGLTGAAIRVVTTDYFRILTDDTERTRVLSTGEWLVGATAKAGTEFVRILKSQNANTLIRMENATSGTLAQASLLLQSSASGILIGHTSAAYTTALGVVANESYVQGGSAGVGLAIAAAGANPIRFLVNGSEQARFIAAGTNRLQGNGGLKVEGGSGVHTLTLSGGDGAASTISIGASDELIGLYGVTAVVQAAKISDPSGGATVDTEARTAINAIIDALEGIGISAAV